MIFITAKFQIRPEDADRWPQIAAEFTEATRSEPGCLWFDWSRSVADPERARGAARRLAAAGLSAGLRAASFSGGSRRR